MMLRVRGCCVCARRVFHHARSSCVTAQTRTHCLRTSGATPRTNDDDDDDTDARIPPPTDRAHTTSRRRGRRRRRIRLVPSTVEQRVHDKRNSSEQSSAAIRKQHKNTHADAADEAAVERPPHTKTSVYTVAANERDALQRSRVRCAEIKRCSTAAASTTQQS